MGTIYRVGIIGLGRMGSTIDDEGHTSLPYSVGASCSASKHLELVAGCDLMSERRTDFAERWGVSAVYEDYREMVEKERPDLVAVCTTATGLPKPGNEAPHSSFRADAHAELAVALAELKVPMLYVEKAMVCSMRRADEIRAAVRRSGTQINTGVLRRFDNRYDPVRTAILEGRIGRPTAALHYADTSLMHGHIHSIDRVLSEITTKDVENYKLARRRSRYRHGKKETCVSEATVNRELCALKVIFRLAKQYGLIEFGPANGVKAYKEQPESPRLLDASEISALLREVPNHLKALVACIVYAGLRRSEVFRLRWDDIDWKAGEITVASRRGAHTKNYASRTIPMNDALVDYLQRHSPVLVRISGHMTKSPYVFSRPNGKPYTDVRDSLRAAAHRAGIEGDVKLQLLRHCFCSHSLMQGADPRSLQRWMGHRDLRTTMGYSHTSPDHEKAAMQRLRYDHGHNTVTMASES